MFQKYFSLVGRLMIAPIFVSAWIGKLSNPGGTEAYMSSHGMPAPVFFLLCSIVVEFLGSAALIVGYKTKWAAFILTLFLIPVTIIFHGDFSDKIQSIMLLKNIAIMGGLLMIAANGAGAISLDAKLDKRSAPGIRE